MNPCYSIAIHGGAGTIRREDMDPSLEQKYTQALEDALAAGYRVLETGGTATDAVAAAVVSLEDCILFNAGRGSVFTRQGQHEMDAAIMDGQTLAAGAVAGVQQVRNPVLLALAVMQKSQHVMLSNAGALQLAREQGLALEPDDYFYSAFRYEQWQQMRLSDQTMLDHNLPGERKFGTVGAVACDRQGNLAAATSTGGMTNKDYNRIGDSPIIGAGTYANNRTCAVSCTGHGEMFIRAVAAYDVSCLMEYNGCTLQEAMNIVTLDKLVHLQGEGGMIGVDARGNAALVFNSEGMYRGLQSSDGTRKVAIYR
ncbi:MAG TPA: isoaspartyl peptidase/L-asparaginase [Lacibacter sp.]|nr:isoaspartyl peptidase/L-asparaginase [Lacibacter sp.]HMO87671.1 isoaspartyl peptidase/L-asparaginase [Lacibacter sp.]HMP87614.1 isoaspartyl peptidase/L-asparaginase [Lacibacter sp.]